MQHNGFYKGLLAIGLMFIVSVFGGCAVKLPSFTRSGIARDTIFSIEQRGNGVTVIWLTHDDYGIYCVGLNEKEKPDQDKLIHHNGEIILKFTGITVDNEDGCARTEVNTQHSGTDYTIYRVVGAIELVPSRK